MAIKITTELMRENTRLTDFKELKDACIDLSRVKTFRANNKSDNLKNANLRGYDEPII